MRIAFIVFFIIVSLLALVLPFTTEFERPEAEQITVEGLPPVPKLGVYDELPNF
ncbi:MAG TPA: peptidoglycan hydrolase, partial [Idiomarina sp.]|nr:peptidoglycan hydrolase [Idiomarina sp.]